MTWKGGHHWGVVAVFSIALHAGVWFSIQHETAASPISGGVISVDFGAAGDSLVAPTSEDPQSDATDNTHTDVSATPEEPPLIEDNKELITPPEEPLPVDPKAVEELIVEPIVEQPIIETVVPETVEVERQVDMQSQTLNIAPSLVPVSPPQQAVSTMPKTVASFPVRNATVSKVSPLNSASPNSNVAPTTTASTVTASSADAAFGFDANKPVSKEISAQYGALVMKHLLKRKRPRASQPGSTFIKFHLNSSGTINSIKISKGSGSKRFDREALRYVKRASPFPKPPVSVELQFNVEIKGS